MKTVVLLTWEGMTKEHYEKLRSIINWQQNPAKGSIFHLAAFNKYGIRVADIWESETDFNNFVRDTLLPAASQAGLTGQPTVELLPVQNVMIPQVEKLLAESASLAGTGA